MKPSYEFHIGQKVIDILDIEGEVIDISRNPQDRYPVKVRFSDGRIHSYTKQGWYHVSDQYAKQDIRPI